MTRPRLGHNPDIKSKPKVSILIPARNESSNLVENLPRILNQTYENFEILIYDDESTDNTIEIFKSIKQTTKCNLRLIKTKLKPPNWVGKSWACHQLSRKARGDILLFVDADTKLEIKALETAVNNFLHYKADLLSISPRQITKSLGEKLIVPLMNWVLLSFLPQNFIFLFRNPSLLAANGQFMMFDKEFYHRIGGHKSVSNHIVEDLELGRLTKKAGGKAMLFLTNDLVSCRMYSSFREAQNGFTKNFFRSTGFPTTFFLLFIALVTSVYTLPYVLISINTSYLIPISLIVIQRVVIAAQTKESILSSIFLSPLQFFILLLLGIKSVFASLTGRIEWKNRHYKNLS